MSLPPLVNVFAIHARHPAVLEPFVATMRATARFELHRPFDTWLVGIEPLPGRAPGRCQAEGRRVFFAEGEDLVVPDGEHGRSAALLRLCELTDNAPTRLAELPGDVGFLLVSRTHGSVVRSAAGLVPWYIHRTTEFVAVSTRLAHFSRLLPNPPGIDALVHASWTDGIVCPNARTPLVGVSAVQAGHVVKLDSDRVGSQLRYWDPARNARDGPSLAPPAHAVRTHAEQLRSLLLARLERDLDPAGGNLLGLSGGVDSSCLAALAVGPAAMPLMTFSFLPARHHPRLAHSLRFVDSIADLVAPVRQWRIHLDEQGRLASHLRAPRLGIPVPHPALSHLVGFRNEEEIRVYTGGEFADDLFGGAFVLWHDWLRELSLLSVLQRLPTRGRLPVRRRVPVRWVSARWRQKLRRPMLPYRLRLPELVRPELREEYRVWSRDRQRAMAALPSPYRYLEMSRQADGWVAQNWEVCSELGVRRSLPFYCRDVMELAFSCSPLELAMPPKNLLRQGFRSDVPPLNLERTDKGSWTEAETVSWGSQIPDRLAGIVRSDWMQTPPLRVSLEAADVLTCLSISTEPVSSFPPARLIKKANEDP